MNTRERILAAGLLAVILLGGGGFLFSQAYLAPLRQRDASIQSARDEIETKRGQLRQALAERDRLERMKQLSLPADVDLARREYEKYLNELMTQSGFQPGSFSVTPKDADARNVPMLANKKPVYTRLTYIVQAHPDLASLVAMLEGFYRTGLLHQIKNVTIQRPLTTTDQQRPTDLDVNLTIEALVVSGAGDRPILLPNVDRRLLVMDAVGGLYQGPGAMALVAWAAGPTGPLGPGNLASPRRDYNAIAAKNIFLGTTLTASQESASVVEVNRYVYLTDISRGGLTPEAFLYDRYDNHFTRLRPVPGFDRFRISASDDAPAVDGKIVQMNDRELVFQSGDRYYSFHVGQSLSEALRRPLSRSQVDALTKGPGKGTASHGPVH